MAPPAWNAGFSRHSPPQAGGIAWGHSSRWRVRLGTPVSRPAPAALRAAEGHLADPRRRLINRYNAFQQVLFNGLFQTFEMQP